MKKKLLAMLLVALSVFCLVGCGKKLEGKWSAEEDGQKVVYEFNDDGTGTVSMMGMTIDTKWETDGDKLTVTMTVLGQSEDVEYTYKIDGDTLTLTDDSDNSVDLERE